MKFGNLWCNSPSMIYAQNGLQHQIMHRNLQERRNRVRKHEQKKRAYKRIERKNSVNKEEFPLFSQYTYVFF